jgi:hypothetical protein
MGEWRGEEHFLPQKRIPLQILLLGAGSFTETVSLDQVASEYSY